MRVVCRLTSFHWRETLDGSDGIGETHQVAKDMTGDGGQDGAWTNVSHIPGEVGRQRQVESEWTRAKGDRVGLTGLDVQVGGVPSKQGRIRQLESCGIQKASRAHRKSTKQSLSRTTQDQEKLTLTSRPQSTIQSLRRPTSLLVNLVSVM